MAYAVQKNSIVEATLRCTMNGQALMTVIHFQDPDASTSTTPDGRANLLQLFNLLDAPGAGWTALRAASCVDSMTIDSVTLQYIWPTRFIRLVEPPDTTTGTIATAAAPQNVAAFVNFTTDQVGQSYRGGMHVGGLVSADVIGGVISNTLKSSLESEANFLISGFTTATAGIAYKVIIFRRHAPGFGLPVTASLAEPTSRTMRRRNVGLGI